MCTAVLLAGGGPRTIAPIEYIWPTIFTFSPHSNPPKSMPAQWRQWTNTTEGKLGGLMHRINKKNCSDSSFPYGTWNSNTHYLPLKFLKISFFVAIKQREKNKNKKNAGYPGTPQKKRVPGYRGVKNWHCPAGRVGSGLQNLAGTRFGRAPAGSSYLQWYVSWYMSLVFFCLLTACMGPFYE